MRRLLTLVVVAVVAASCAQTVNVEQEKAALMAVGRRMGQVDQRRRQIRSSFLAPDGTWRCPAAPAMKGAEDDQAQR